MEFQMHHLLKDVTKIQNGMIHGMIHGMNKFKEKLCFINVALFYQYNTFITPRIALLFI